MKHPIIQTASSGASCMIGDLALERRLLTIRGILIRSKGSFFDTIRVVFAWLSPPHRSMVLGAGRPWTRIIRASWRLCVLSEKLTSKPFFLGPPSLLRGVFFNSSVPACSAPLRERDPPLDRPSYYVLLVVLDPDFSTRLHRLSRIE